MEIWEKMKIWYEFGENFESWGKNWKFEIMSKFG